MIHIVVATQKQKGLIYLGDRLSLHFRGTVCVPLDVLLLILYFHVFSGLSVLLFSVYVQLRQNVPCPTRKMVQCHYQQLICWHITVSTPTQCERCEESLVSILSPHCISNSNSIFWRHWRAAVRSQRTLGLTVVGPSRVNVNFHFSHTCCHCPYILYKVPPMAGVHSAQTTTVVWLVICCVAMNIATLWLIAKLFAASSVQLLRYQTKSSAFLSSDTWWEKWPGLISSKKISSYLNSLVCSRARKHSCFLKETDQHSWSPLCI